MESMMNLGQASSDAVHNKDLTQLFTFFIFASVTDFLVPKKKKQRKFTINYGMLYFVFCAVIF